MHRWTVIYCNQRWTVLARSIVINGGLRLSFLCIACGCCAARMTTQHAAHEATQGPRASGPTTTCERACGMRYMRRQVGWSSSSLSSKEACTGTAMQTATACRLQGKPMGRVSFDWVPAGSSFGGSPVALSKSRCKPPARRQSGGADLRRPRDDHGREAGSSGRMGR